LKQIQVVKFSRFETSPRMIFDAELLVSVAAALQFLPKSPD
jgi:hypothetical protein